MANQSIVKAFERMWQHTLAVIDDKCENASGDCGIDITQSEYDTLSEEEKMQGTYYITDGVGGGSGSSAQADWNINDENASGYIKNRPFYTSDPVETVLFDGNVVIQNSINDGSLPFVIEVGVEYNVNFNGTEYVLVGTTCPYGAFIGNTLMFGGANNGIPFCIINGSIGVLIGDGTYPLTVTSTVSEVHKIDEKYLPTTVGLAVAGKTLIYYDQVDGTPHEVVAQDGAEIFNDYYTNVAGGEYSHAEGASTTAIGSYSHAEGLSTVASGIASHAEGWGTMSSAPRSHAEGERTTASGEYSHAEGYMTVASGRASHAEGYCTEAKQNQHAQGHFNDASLCAAGGATGTNGTAFVIGNGNGTAPSNACRITYAGQVIGKGSYSSTGADYAEYFEWADGNPENEDRVGYFVTFEDGELIRKANAGEYILGIVSGNPAVLGNHDECWLGKNEMDEWNRFIYVTETATDEKTGETYEYQTYKINPNYDATKQYIPRAERPEWDAIGMIGVLSVRDDGTCQRNGYCKVADGGVATHSDEVTNIRVLSRVNDSIVKVLLK